MRKYIFIASGKKGTCQNKLDGKPDQEDGVMVMVSSS